MNHSTALNHKHGLRRLGLLSLPALAVMGALVIVFRLGGGHQAQADFPHTGLNFSVSSGVGGEQCDSDSSGGLPTTCTFSTSATFTANFRVNALPQGFAYSGYDSAIRYTAGLTADNSSLTQQGTGTWTECAFPVQFAQPGLVAPGCAGGLPTAPATLPTSTYTGVMWHINFSCGAGNSTETITLASGDGNTDLVDGNSVAHGEDTDELVTINCGAGGNTPGPATPTATRTATRTATQTPTRTPTPGACARLGDVNADGHTNSLDALSILQFDARLLEHVPQPACGDLNHDGMINAIDALFVLQIDAGLLPQP